MRRRSIHWGYLAAAVGLAVVTYIASLVLFPDWRQSVPQMAALGALVLVTVVAFLAALRQLLEPPSQPSHTGASTPILVETHIEQNISAGEIHAGQDVVRGDKNVSQTAGGDIVGRDKIMQAAPEKGVDALHQLPAPAADFTGREAELAELRAAVKAQGVTISGLRGMGGVGKTALAVVLANELAAEYPDAQIMVDLLGTSRPLTPAAAMEAVVRAFEPVAKLPDDDAGMLAAYRSVLHGKRAMLLMDNAAGREQVEPLAPPPGCLMLVTSRTRFALPGLKAVNLDSLPPGDAVALLLKIAPRIGDMAGELAELCGRLPLALRLAGSALAVREELEPDEYAQRLRSEKGRMAELDEVAASLALSNALLGEELRGLWRRLGVFVGDFDGPAAGAVWALEADRAGEHLGTLLRYSLVDFEAGAKRWRLHDLARDFARTRLEAAEGEATRGRHAAHYKAVLAAADELYLKGGAGILRGLALFDLERANILAGQAWAVAQSGPNESAAQLASDYPDAGVYVLELRQHPRERTAWLEAALKAARQLGNRVAEGAHLGNLGNAYADLGETRRAIESYEQRLVIAREIGDRRGEGAALGNLGIAYKNLGETRRAIEYHEQHLAITREISDRRGEGAALGNLGNAYADLGETRRAIEYHEQALVIDREIGDRRGEGQDLGNLGLAYAALGETRQAIKYHEQHLAIGREIGDRRGEGNALGNLGNAYKNLGETRRAIEYYEQRLVIAREIGDRRGEGNALWNSALALDSLGDREVAIVNAEAALKIGEEIEDPNAEMVRRQLAEWKGQAAP